MAENRLGFLYKAAAVLAQTENKSYDILRSHYLMRCPELRSSKQISSGRLSKERCSYCCLAWKKDAKLRVNPMKLSRRQKKRLKSKKDNTQYNSKQVERICSLCGHTSVVHVLKLDEKIESDISIVVKDEITKKQIKEKRDPKLRPLNVYTNIREVFSIKNENNKITPEIVPSKIRNNKRKKDRFAGLCQKAVMDAAKRKNEDEKKNTLNLFLKPSSLS
ncbi:uncharacterized protein LOC110998694 [Pieris rapae]|uniref:uncharacterized protein LOC110998694 n=1 Tax=Pieris rapae TaxID=64459 RepID=UPI001E27FD63|nr:uncharacterized protein LOC110998694 [Pieris rapae]